MSPNAPALTADTLTAICDAFALGDPAQASTTLIQSGLMHRCWQLMLPSGDYLLKQLHCHNIQQLLPQQSHEAAEQIRHYFYQRGVPCQQAASTLTGCLRLHLDSQQFALYHWQSGQVGVGVNAKQVAAILAKMHQCSPKRHLFMPQPLSQAKWRTTWQLACQQMSLSHLTKLAEEIEHSIIPYINDHYKAAKMRTCVLSHRDLRPDNVIWSKGLPAIIDWELAGWIPASTDLLSTALDWSVDSNLMSPNFDKLAGFMAHYHDTSDTQLTINDQDWARVASSWLDWAHWSLIIGLTNKSLQSRALQEIKFSLHCLSNTDKIAQGRTIFYRNSLY